jgi:hypothetical protein
MNTRFSYLYRDGDNYKNYGEIIASGSLCEAERRTLAASLMYGQNFMAHHVGFPEIFLFAPVGAYDPSEMDHTLHEFGETTDTFDLPTDDRTASEIVVAFAQAATEGWDEFFLEQGERTGVGRSTAYREGVSAQ